MKWRRIKGNIPVWFYYYDPQADHGITGGHLLRPIHLHHGVWRVGIAISYSLDPLNERVVTQRVINDTKVVITSGELYIQRKKRLALRVVFTRKRRTYTKGNPKTRQVQNLFGDGSAFCRASWQWTASRPSQFDSIRMKGRKESALWGRFWMIGKRCNCYIHDAGLPKIFTRLFCFKKARGSTASSKQCIYWKNFRPTNIVTNSST